MKKLILLSIAIVFAIGLNAQKLVPSLYYGFSVTNLKGDSQIRCDALENEWEEAFLDEGLHTSFEYNTRARYPLFNIGLALEYRPLNWLAVNGGVEYAPRGIVWKGSSYIQGYELEIIEKWKLRYLDIPIFAKFSTGLNSKNENRGYLKVGVNPSFLMSSVYTEEAYFDDELLLDGKGDLTGFTKNDLAILYGFGFDVGTSYFDFTFKRGMNNVIEGGDGLFELSNTMFVFGWGFNFNKGK